MLKDQAGSKVQISIVMPLFNKENTVERAIRSVLSQTDADFELIIVDDGSTDLSYQRCLTFVDPRIRIIQQTNQGVAAARNNGVEAGTGTYLCFLDADDAYEPSFLQQIRALVALNPDAALYSCRYQVMAKSGKLQQFKCQYANDFAGPVADFFNAYRQNRGFICSSCFAISRTMFQRAGGFPAGVRIGEDISLWLKAALLGPTLFSGTLGATIYQDAENRTETTQPDVVAAHIAYFLRDNAWTAGVSAAQVRSAQHFIRANTLVSALGALSNGKVQLARQYADLLQPHYPFRALLVRLCSLMPTSWFEALRHIRNLVTTQKFYRKNH